MVMPPERQCPKCGSVMHYDEEDPETGIVEGWACDCGHSEVRDYDESDYDDPRG